MDFVIRPVRPEELTAVGELTARAYAAVLPDGDTYLEELRNAAHRAEHTELLVAVDTAGEILGSVAFVTPGSAYTELARDGEGEFRMLGVDPRFQGRGTAEALVRACIERARELGMSRIVISTGQNMYAAHRLYRRLGFDRLPQRDWTPVPGVDLHAYSVELPSQL